ncbi:MAG: lysophospholipid acyltransferase family protein [bacterium]|jgi:Kdo2-lipid IVA lauroyltransferase/acyltransferase
MMKFRDQFLKIIISVLASLPLGVLYILSDALAFLGRNIFHYRKEVIMRNLESSFPEKEPAEIKKIARRFYRNLTDFAVELIKSSRMPPELLESRVVFKNKEVIDRFYEDGKSVFLSLGHCGNWEWVGNRVALFLKHHGAAIYKPIHDPFFDRYMIGIRQKYKGTLMIDYKKVYRTLLPLKNQLYTVFVLADQSPARTEIDHFEEFLGQKTAFYNGMEKVARGLGYAVAYLDVQRTKRGFYQVEVKTITKDAGIEPVGMITTRYVKMLEASIIRQPDNWLWSHRRWKQKEKKKS